MLAINVKQTRARFLDRILDGSKTVETRANRAWHCMRNAGIIPGRRVALVSAFVVYGYAVIGSVIEYEDVEQFRHDVARHHVQPGSAFDWNHGKGKVGLVLEAVERCTPYAVPKLNRPAGFRII